jgi:hypothetical protein
MCNAPMVITIHSQSSFKGGSEIGGMPVLRMVFRLPGL